MLAGSGIRCATKAMAKSQTATTIVTHARHTYSRVLSNPYKSPSNPETPGKSIYYIPNPMLLTCILYNRRLYANLVVAFPNPSILDRCVASRCSGQFICLLDGSDDAHPFPFVVPISSTACVRRVVTPVRSSISSARYDSANRLIINSYLHNASANFPPLTKSRTHVNIVTALLGTVRTRLILNPL
jgi:hypothetical protein